MATRSAFEHRGVVLGGDPAESLAGLEALAAGGDSPSVVCGTAGDPVGPVVFVFPGQGSQWVGMGRRLYAESEVFARGIDDCARALAPWTARARVDVVQPALFAMMVSLARVWQSLGVVPEVVVGHSQGEIAAACVAGALSLEDAARVVAVRSLALTELAGSGGMSSVSADPAWVRDRLARWSGRLSVAAVNGPASVVISGEAEALEEFAKLAADDDVRVRRIKVDYASHSHQVESIRERLLAVTADLSPRAAAMEFHSTVTGGALDTSMLDGSYWYENLRSTVRFGEVVEHLMRDRGGVFVEVSPHPVLEVALAETADLLAASPPVVGTVHKEDGSAAEVLASLAVLYVRGVSVDWEAAFPSDGPRRIGLPTYPFQRQRYWLTAPDGADLVDPGSGGRLRSAEPASESSVLDLVCAEAARVLAQKDKSLTATRLVARSTDTFKDLGFDSSMAVLLRDRLTKAVEVRLSATVAFSHPTPHALSRHIFSLLELQAPEAPAAESSVEDPSDDELYALIDGGYA